MSNAIPERISNVRIDLFMTPENRDFDEKCTFLENFEIEQIFGFDNSKLTLSSIWAALPGAPAPGKARRPQPHMACRDGDSSPLEEQYFKEQTAGKSWRKC